VRQRGQRGGGEGEKEGRTHDGHVAFVCAHAGDDDAEFEQPEEDVEGVECDWGDDPGGREGRVVANGDEEDGEGEEAAMLGENKIDG
jgi:hypothetical protein